VQLYHYYPTNVPLTARLTLTTTSQAGAYNKSRFGFGFEIRPKAWKICRRKPPGAEKAVISVLRDPGRDQPAYLDFDLPVQVRGAFWQTLGYGIVLGILLAGPRLSLRFLIPVCQIRNAVFVCVATGIIGLLDQESWRAFGLKKSP